MRDIFVNFILEQIQSMEHASGPKMVSNLLYQDNQWLALEGSNAFIKLVILTCHSIR